MYNILCPYWTSNDVQAIQGVESFEEAADICLSVLKRIPQSPPISQLCGPISTGGFNDFQKNIVLFNRCVEELRQKGLNPFDQGPVQYAIDKLIHPWNEANGKRYCTPILEVIFQRIFESGLVKRVYFLPDWETSFGSTWERHITTELGIEVNEFPREWYDLIMRELEEKWTTQESWKG